VNNDRLSSWENVKMEKTAKQPNRKTEKLGFLKRNKKKMDKRLNINSILYSIYTLEY